MNRKPFSWDFWVAISTTALFAVLVALMLSLGGCALFDKDKVLDYLKDASVVEDLVPTPDPEPEPEPAAVEPGVPPDQWLDEIRLTSPLRIEKTPDVTENRVTFSDGNVMQFTTYNVGDFWKDGKIIRPDGRVETFDANWELRHGALRVLGETNARQLGANQTRHGEPAVSFEYEGSYYWKSADGKQMFEVDGMNLYAIRVAEAVKGRFNISGEITRVSGKILRYRQ